MAALTKNALDGVELKIKSGAPSDILSAVGALREMASAGLAKIEALSSENSNLEDRLAEVMTELDEVRDERDAVLDGAINDLEGVRRMVKAGRYDEAVHVLDRLLQENDPTCKRTSTVVLPVHGGGFL